MSEVNGGRPLVLASPQHRLGGLVLDGLFNGLVVTLMLFTGVLSILSAFTDNGDSVSAGGLIFTFLLGVAWFAVQMIFWAKGQTPAKAVLKMRVYDATKGTPAKWGQMAVRQFLIPLALSMIYFILLLITGGSSINSDGSVSGLSGLTVIIELAYLAFYITDACFVFRADRKRIIDSWAKSVVINEAA
jgi:hypothetical protein